MIAEGERPVATARIATNVMAVWNIHWTTPGFSEKARPLEKSAVTNGSVVNMAMNIQPCTAV